MTERLAGAAAAIVGGALGVVAIVEYVLPGVSASAWDPLATGVLVAGSGLVLLVAGGIAIASRTDVLAVRAATAVGVVTLALAVFEPAALRFGGVFWLGLVAAGIVTAGAVGTVRAARRSSGP